MWAAAFRFVPCPPSSKESLMIRSKGGLTRLLCAIGVFGTLLALIAGCGSGGGGSSSSATGSTSESDQIKVGWFTVGPNSYLEGDFAGARRVAEKENATLTVVDPNFDATKQIGQIQDAVASKQFDAIIITALNQVGVVPPVKEAIAAGIPVVGGFSPIGPRTDTLDPQVEGMAAQVGVTQDEYGQSTAEMAIKACAGKDPCNIGYEELTGSFSGDLATQAAFKEAEEEFPNIHVVASVPTENLRDKAVSATEDIMQAHPDISVIACSGDQVATGAEIALKGMGIDNVIINGAGASRPGIAKVRSGDWFGTVLLVPEEEGEIIMEDAIAAARGETISEPGVNPVKAVGLPPLFTQENAKSLSDFEGQWAG
jgi:ribose transport system substrate-binding protein